MVYIKILKKILNISFQNEHVWANDKNDNDHVHMTQLFVLLLIL